MSNKYFGSFKNLDEVVAAFQLPEGHGYTDADIVLAVYDQEDYEGSAVVVFRRDGNLYEVHGSHCSCYGLEGQWEPEETSVAALLMQKQWTEEQRGLIAAAGGQP